MATTTLLIAAMMLVPVALMVSSSIRPVTEVLAYPPKFLPAAITLQPYEDVVTNPDTQHHFLNSIILTLTTVTLCLLLGFLAAYGFSRFRIRGANIVLLGLLALMAIPAVLMIIPYFDLFSTLGIRDNIVALIIANTTISLPLTIWLLKGYMDSIPDVLDEAAMIDGCSRFGVMRRILLPLALPGLIGVGTFVFLGTWNEYILAVALTDTPASQPVTVALAKFFGRTSRDWSAIMALASMVSLIPLMLFTVAQRWVVSGLTAGALK